MHISPDPNRIPPSMKFLRRYNVNRAFDIRPAYPAVLGQVQITEGPGGVSAPSMPLPGILTVQQMVANQLRIEEQLARLIYASQFEQAWQAGLVPTESFTLKDKSVVKVPARSFNWSAYRFDWDAAEAVAKRKGRSLIMATHPKIRKFTADEINRLWALTIHEDGGPVQYTGDKMRRFLAQQESQWISAVRPIAMYKIPAMQIAPSREQRKISESLLKVGTMAVAVVGAAFLGNAIVGKLGAGAAEGAAAAAGVEGATVGGALAAGEAAAVGIAVPTLTPTITYTVAGSSLTAGAVIETAGALGATTLLGIAKETAPKVIDTINTTRTITAIAKGELPPPPIRPMDGSFTDWAMLVAVDKMEADLMRKLSEAEQVALLMQIQKEQELMALYGGNSPTTSGTSVLDPRILAMQAQEKGKVPGWLILLPVAAMFLMG